MKRKGNCSGVHLLDNWPLSVYHKDRMKTRDKRDDLVTKSYLKKCLEPLARKEDLKKFATKEDLKRFPTKEDLKKFATKEDLKRFATKEDLKKFATKEDLKRFATKEDFYDLQNQIWELREEFTAKLVEFKDQILTA